MKVFNAEHLKELTKQKSEPCISIYIPTKYEWSDKEQDRIRFKNQLQNVQSILKEKDYDPKKIDKLLKEANALYKNEDFWKKTGRGLAMFISPDETQYYRLPVEFDEYSEVSSNYHIKPLMPLVTEDGKYFVITLDLNETKLYHGSKFAISQIELSNDTPTGLDEAMKLDDPEKSIQFHTGAGGTAGDRPAVFHGQGTGTDDKLEKKQILRFFQMYDNGVMERLANENAPMILLGIEYLIPIYSEANSYPHLVEESVDINPQELSPKEVHSKAWEKIEPYFKAKEKEALEEYGNKTNENLASDNIEEIVKGAVNQRIDKLFINKQKQTWGRFDEENDQLIIDPKQTNENIDLQNFTITHTINNSGTVYRIDEERMPNDQSMAAVFRYPVN